MYQCAKKREHHCISICDAKTEEENSFHVTFDFPICGLWVARVCSWRIRSMFVHPGPMFGVDRRTNRFHLTEWILYKSAVINVKVMHPKPKSLRRTYLNGFSLRTARCRIGSSREKNSQDEKKKCVYRSKCMRIIKIKIIFRSARYLFRPKILTHIEHGKIHQWNIDKTFGESRKSTIITMWIIWVFFSLFPFPLNVLAWQMPTLIEWRMKNGFGLWNFRNLYNNLTLEFQTSASFMIRTFYVHTSNPPCALYHSLAIITNRNINVNFFFARFNLIHINDISKEIFAFCTMYNVAYKLNKNFIETELFTQTNLLKNTLFKLNDRKWTSYCCAWRSCNFAGRMTLEFCKTNNRTACYCPFWLRICIENYENI